MRKLQVLKFWAELQRATDTASVLRKYKDKEGYRSERTLSRYVQAFKGFSDGLSIEVVSARTGWTPLRLNTLRDWFEKAYSPHTPAEDASASFQRAHLLEISGHALELREAAIDLEQKLGSPLQHYLGLFNLPAIPVIDLALGDGLEAFGELPLLAAL